MTTSQWYLMTWGLVGLVWMVGALYNALFGPKVVEERWGARASVWLVGLILFVLFDRILPRNWWTAITFQSDWFWEAGVLILVLSTAFVLWARWVLGQLWSGTAAVKQDHRLRTEGPYKITRHPIYTGLLGMTFGTMLMNGFGFMLPAILVMLVFFELKIHWEEGLLTRTFGEQYVEYKRRVPQLVPGLVLRRSN